MGILVRVKGGGLELFNLWMLYGEFSITEIARAPQMWPYSQ